MKFLTLILIRILGIKVVIYLEKALPHDPITPLPDLKITDKELPENKVSIRCCLK